MYKHDKCVVVKEIQTLHTSNITTISTLDIAHSWDRHEKGADAQTLSAEISMDFSFLKLAALIFLLDSS